MIHKPNVWQALTHAFLISIAFTLRYNAMYYPIVSTVALILWQRKVAVRLFAFVLPALSIGLFVAYTRKAAKEITGIDQFSVLSGWHWANNALYMYPYIDVDSSTMPVRAKELNRMSQEYFRHVPPDVQRSASPLNGGFYIRYYYGPLKQYLLLHFPNQWHTTKAWGSVAPVYDEFGKHLIREHPWAYIWHYVVPNFINYLLPPLEKLKVYNLGENHVQKVAVSWFDYRNSEVRSISSGAQGMVLLPFPGIFFLANIGLIGAVVFFIKDRDYRTNNFLGQSLLLVAILFVANLAFSVLAAPIAMRYFVFSLVIYFAFATILIDLKVKQYDDKAALKAKSTETNEKGGETNSVVSAQDFPKLS